jgi:thiaminase/transcriptional activator TenA
MSGRSTDLLARKASRLEQSIQQPFIVAASTGTLPAESFARYLLIEESFVKTAVRINAYALYAEPDDAAAGHHAAAINSLLGPQLQYFSTVRAQHVVVGGEQDSILKLASLLSTHVLGAIESHGYAGAVVSMFAAETLYLTWCSRARAHRELAAANDLDEWIRLHTTAEFEAQVASLQHFVDLLDEPDEVLDTLFAGMLVAEDSFHSAAF